MSGNDKNSTLYSASDIQKYLRGELSAPEMHRMERAALEDPFLSDALEGMEIHQSHPSSPSLAQDLDELQQRLDRRIGKEEQRGIVVPMVPSPKKDTRRARLYPWRIAAVLILLLGLGLTAYYTFLTTARQKNSLAKAAESKSELASKAQQSPATSPAPAAADTTTLKLNEPPKTTSLPGKAPESIASATTTAKKQAVRKEPAVANEADIPAQSDGRADSSTLVATGREKETETLAKITPGLAINRESKSLPATTVPKTAAPTTIGQQDKVRATSSSEMFRRRADASSYKKDTATYQSFAVIPEQPVYTGKVIDQNNNPLPGASLFLAGYYSVSSTVTDKNGLFSLRLPKKDSAIKLTVASVGFEEASLSLNMQNRTGNVIRLQPQNNALNEVVVTGYGAKRKEIVQNNSQPQKPFVTKKAAPVDGWPAYQIYLEANKKLINPDSTIKGDEIISFLVSKEGGLSSFKVEQSLSSAHDSAAIHLIQQGPSWKLLKGKKGRAWVTISF